jgi:hypothetical protein
MELVFDYTYAQLQKHLINFRSFKYITLFGHLTLIFRMINLTILLFLVTFCDIFKII